MSEAIKVSRSDVRDVVSATFPDYKGRTFRVDGSGRVTFHDVNWGGGSRNYYRSFRFADGMAFGLPESLPWSNPVEGKNIDIPAGWAVVEYTIFCGHDCGITVHVRPENMPRRIAAEGVRA